MPKGIPLTDIEIQRRRREIFQAAAEIIVKQGFTDTSMQEIARVAGVGKSTLYDYFKTKDEVLLYIFEEGLASLNQEAEAVSMQVIPAHEKMWKILELSLVFLTQNKHFFTEISSQAQQMSQASQQRIMRLRYIYQDLLRKVIEQGIAEGSFRKVNSRLAARLLISSMEVLVYTTRPTGTAQEMLADVKDLFLCGMQA